MPSGRNKPRFGRGSRTLLCDCTHLNWEHFPEDDPTELGGPCHVAGCGCPRFLEVPGRPHIGRVGRVPYMQPAIDEQERQAAATPAPTDQQTDS